jgi:hypothetical protein
MFNEMRGKQSDFMLCDIYTAINIPAMDLSETNELQKLTAYADKQRLY